MVSFHTPLSPTGRKTIPEFENLSKKRKLEGLQVEDIKAKSLKSIFNTELHLETPLPLDWQRCLDITSGRIHFYNTRTQKRTSKDPRLSPEPPSPSHMSLDLELNLPCGSSFVTKNHASNNFTNHNSGSSLNDIDSGDDDDDDDDNDNDNDNDNDDDQKNIKKKKKNKNSGGLTRIPSWLAFEGDEREMVTAVCKRCHMLVMMCKSSPACPNCKFMHPTDQTSPNSFKQGLSLLC